MDLLGEILRAIWFVGPAYIANGFTPIWGRGERFNAPIDMNRYFSDGNRLLGDGKTIRGGLGGLVMGFLSGIIQNELKIFNMHFSLLLSFLLAFGAILGDSIGSFIKRRLNRTRGESVLGLDQLGFLVTALVLANVFLPDQVLSQYWIILIPTTLIIHRGMNIFAYFLHIKNVPY
ncbi:MAG: CDP-2,3-bis-(O-geranylgeranyl)-sn-glycerol synthase [Promethearchaeota archaeon]